MELCQPQDPVSTLAMPGPCVTQGSLCQRCQAEAREGGLAECCGESWKGHEGMPVVRQAVAGSICQWFPGRRECQEMCVSGCEPGGDSLMSDRGLYTRSGFIPGSQHLDRLCAGAAHGSLSRPAAFH